MAGCVLRVEGSSFDVDRFMAGSKLSPCKIWHVGEKAGKTRPASVTAGIHVVTSNADDLPTQIEQTLEFLRRRRDELLRLRDEKGVDDLLLDFSVLDRDVAAQYDRFPAELVRVASDYGMAIEISRYRAGGE